MKDEDECTEYFNKKVWDKFKRFESYLHFKGRDIFLYNTIYGIIGIRTG